MTTLFQLMFEPENVVLTTLMAIVLLYWLTVIFGLVDLDSMDIDIDVDTDIDIDTDVDVDTEADIDGGGSWALDLLAFFHFGALPFMIVMSVLLTSMWSISILCNNPHSPINPEGHWWMTLLLIIPNLIVSLFVTKLVTWPLIPLFARLDSSGAKNIDFVGKTGELTTSADTLHFGQIRVVINQSPYLLHVKTMHGKLKKGTPVVIVDTIEQEQCYVVQALHEVLSA